MYKMKDKPWRKEHNVSNLERCTETCGVLTNNIYRLNKYQFLELREKVRPWLRFLDGAFQMGLL